MVTFKTELVFVEKNAKDNLTVVFLEKNWIPYFVQDFSKI